MADGGEFPGWRICAEEFLGKLPRWLQVTRENEHLKEELEFCRRLLTKGYNEADASALGWVLVADATLVETFPGYKDSLSSAIDATSEDEGSSTLKLFACVHLARSEVLEAIFSAAFGYQLWSPGSTPLAHLQVP